MTRGARQKIYDELVRKGIRHPFVDKGWNQYLLKSGWYFVEFGRNAVWLGKSAKEALGRIELMFSD